VVPLKIWQMQGPLQWTVVLHVPLQTGSKLAGVRSCRAEIVPAQRTAAAIAARNVFLIVLPMIHSPFCNTAEKDEHVRLLCRSGCNEFALAYGGSGVVEDACAAQNVGAPCFLGAEAAAGGLERPEQLACGNRSRAQNSGSHRHQDDVLKFLTHGSSAFFTRTDLKRKR
jgi:hypothetical protein